MTRVLVTGATGFVGRHALTPLLEAGFEVHAVSHSSPFEIDPRVQWHQADLLDHRQTEELVASVAATHLLHLAWYAEPGLFWTSTENLRWLRASLDLLEAFVKSGGQRVVMGGSCAEYDLRHGFCTEEVTPLVPSNLYGDSKHALSIALRSYCRQTGVSWGWGRIFFLFGPHEHPARLVPSVIGSLISGQVAKCTHGEQIRDFLYVKDCAQAFVALLRSPVEGFVNIGSGNPMRIRELVHAIGTKLGKTDSIHMGALPTREGEPGVILADTTRLHSEVGFHPSFGLDASLDETIEWWRGRLEAGSA